MQKSSLIYAQEVERVLYEASSAWEGIDAQEISLGVGGVILRIQPGFAAAMPLRFDAAIVEEQLDRAVGQIEKLVPWCLWVIGPSSQPADLRPQLIFARLSVLQKSCIVSLGSKELPPEAELVLSDICMLQSGRSIHVHCPLWLWVGHTLVLGFS
ncbi:MAG TPA: hypothetical protein VIY29_05895 [Ktedonobacteraceae bacterium]